MEMEGRGESVGIKKSLKALVLSLLRSYFALHLARLLVPSLVCSESCTIGSCSKAVDSLKDESTFSIRGILLMKDLRGAAGYQKKNGAPSLRDE